MITELPLPGIEGSPLDSGNIWPVVTMASVNQASVWEVTSQTDDTPCDDTVMTWLHTLQRGWLEFSANRLFRHLALTILPSNAQARDLSESHQWMLAIARTLIAPTELLTLGKPFEGLAPKIIETNQETIMERKRDNIIPVVERDVPVARAASNRYSIFDRGEKVSEGSMRQLDGDEEPRREVLRSDLTVFWNPPHSRGGTDA